MVLTEVFDDGDTDLAAAAGDQDGGVVEGHCELRLLGKTLGLR